MGHPPNQRPGRADPPGRGTEATVAGKLQTGSDLVPGREGYLQFPAVRCTHRYAPGDHHPLPRSSDESDHAPRCGEGRMERGSLDLPQPAGRAIR